MGSHSLTLLPLSLYLAGGICLCLGLSCLVFLLSLVFRIVRLPPSFSCFVAESSCYCKLGLFPTMAGQNNSFDMQIKLLMIGDSGKRETGFWKRRLGSLEISISFHTRRLNDVPFAVSFSGVGKTCLLLRYASEPVFSPTFITTIGIDFKIKNIVLDDKRIKLQVFNLFVLPRC